MHDLILLQLKTFFFCFVQKINFKKFPFFATNEKCRDFAAKYSLTSQYFQNKIFTEDFF